MDEEFGMAKKYSEAERELLCKKYQTGKRSRKEFCEAHDISTKSLSRWLLKTQRQKFVAIGELPASNDILAEINLPSGINIKLRLKEAEFPRLIKGLL